MPKDTHMLYRWVMDRMLKERQRARKWEEKVALYAVERHARIEDATVVAAPSRNDPKGREGIGIAVNVVALELGK